MEGIKAKKMEEGNSKIKNQPKEPMTRSQKIKLLFIILKLLVLLFIIIAIPLYLILFEKDLITSLRSMEDVNAILAANRTQGIFIVIGLQIAQVIISIIPGNAVQFATGYVYRFILGYLISAIGLVIGSVISFQLAKVLGTDAMNVLFGEERFTRFLEKFNSKRGFIFTFVFFLIPGLPKDLLCYVAGISKMRLLPFLALSMVARTPGVMGSIMMGSMFANGRYEGMVALVTLAALLCYFGIKYHEKLSQKIDMWYEKMSGDKKNTL